MTQGVQRPRVGHSFGTGWMHLAGVFYPHGIGTHAVSEMRVDLKGVATGFASMVGIDSEQKTHGSVRFTVWVDGHRAVETPILRGGAPPREIRVDLRGAHTMILVVDDGGDGWDYDDADWAGAMIFLVPGTSVRPVSMPIPRALPALPQVSVVHGQGRMWLLPAVLVIGIGGMLLMIAFHSRIVRRDGDSV